MGKASLGRASFWIKSPCRCSPRWPTVFGPTRSPDCLRGPPCVSTGLERLTGERPTTRYARSGSVSIAYQVIGDGPRDLVFVGGWVSHLEAAWDQPLVARYLRRLASFSRLILFDKRGTGLSDRVADRDLPTLEQRMDDVRAVMDAAASERAAIFGQSEGASMAILFAATYPERTTALITFGAFACRIWNPEYPWAPTPQQRQAFYDVIEHDRGRDADVAELAPSIAGDEGFKRWFGT